MWEAFVLDQLVKDRIRELASLGERARLRVFHSTLDASQEVSMADQPFASDHISRIVSPSPGRDGEPRWRPVRHHFGIRAFGVNAYTARERGSALIEEHDELPGPGTDQAHEELYFVASGHAAFTVDGRAVDAPAGTFVFVRDPELVRSATARDPDTTVLVIGAQPGVPFEVSRWERTRTGADAG